MTKAELISKIAEEANITKKDTRLVWDAMVKVVKESLMADEKITLEGVCVLKTVPVPARIGHNPATGESITIPEHKKMKMSVAGAFKEYLKNCR